MATPRTLYQIFISSTYVDLHEERKAVTWAILKTRNTPAGMESFPASDDRGWKTIQRTIDDSDFYVLLLGYRYGSIDPATGLSWTRKEYRYARSKGIPVLVFLRELKSVPGDQVDADRTHIEDFRKEASDAHKYSAWETEDELTGLVRDAIHSAIEDNSDDPNPRLGWVRGTNNAANVAGEMAALLEENRRLRDQLSERNDANAERVPSVMFVKHGVATSENGVVFGVDIQNVGVCGIVLDEVQWLWEARKGVMGEKSKKQPAQFIAPGGKQISLRLDIPKKDMPKVHPSHYNLTRATIIVTMTSKPHNITVTESFAINGEILPEDVPTT